MYRVRWSRAALDDLTAAWMVADSSQRHAITSAAHEIERLLRYKPAQEGESRPAHKRILFVHPLGVLYQVDEANRQVGIGEVWIIKRHR